MQAALAEAEPQLPEESDGIEDTGARPWRLSGVYLSKRVMSRYRDKSKHKYRDKYKRYTGLPSHEVNFLPRIYTHKMVREKTV